MSATIVDIADAVVAELNVASRFSMAVAAEREWSPVFEVEDMAALKVTVVPRGEGAQEAATRAKIWQREYRVDLAVMKRVNRSAQKAEVDALVLLVEEIAEWFRRQRPLASQQGFHCPSAEIDPVCDPAHLDQLSQFTSLVTLTFREWR